MHVMQQLFVFKTLVTRPRDRNRSKCVGFPGRRARGVKCRSCSARRRQATQALVEVVCDCQRGGGLSASPADASAALTPTPATRCVGNTTNEKDARAWYAEVTSIRFCCETNGGFWLLT